MTTLVETTSRVVHNIPTKILPSLSIAEQYYILEGCRDNCRLDGRSRNSLRPFTLITSDPLVLSHGSSRIIAQKTEIICSVKAELVHPRVEAPDKGVLEIHVDIGSDAGDYRKRRLTEHQLQASLNFLLSDKLIPLQSLCVVEGHYVWKLHCDIIVLSLEGGSIIDVASRALRGALMQTKIPHILPLSNKGQAQMDLAIDGDIQKAQNAVGEDSEDLCPVIVSVAVCKCPPKSIPVLVLDTTLEEELCASCIVRVAVAHSGDIVAIQSMNGSLPIGLLTDIKSAAIQASKQVFQALDHTVTTSNMESLLQPAFQIQ